MEFEDISSYSEGNADFYMNPRKEQADKVNKKNNHNKKKREKDNFFARNNYKN